MSSRVGHSEDGLRERVGLARNTLYLVVGQLATAALSFGVTMLLARHLGAEEYGVFYLAGAFAQSAFMLVDLGQDYYVVRALASDRARAPALLGTGLALRIAAALTMFPVLVGAAGILGYPEATRRAIFLVAVFYLLSSLGDGFHVVFRGLERMEYEAASRVTAKALVAVAIVLAVALDGTLVAILNAQIVAAGLALPACAALVQRLRIPRARVDTRNALSILYGGAPFLLWNIVVTSHPSLDAIMLSKLASADAVGWYGAAWRLTGLLIFPATIIAASLYPALSRLFAERSERYWELTRSALRCVVLLGTLSATGTYLFADGAVDLIYGRQAFGPTATDLKILTLFIILVFVNITLGAAIMAANKQMPWTWVKTGCVLLAAGLNAVLIPAGESAFANGGIGTGVSTVATEVVMLIAAFVLVPIPKAALLRALGGDLLRAAAAAAGMGGIIWLLGDVATGIGIAAAVLGYLAALLLLGAISKEDLGVLRAVVRYRSGVAAAGTEGT